MLGVAASRKLKRNNQNAGAGSKERKKTKIYRQPNAKGKFVRWFIARQQNPCVAWAIVEIEIKSRIKKKTLFMWLYFSKNKISYFSLFFSEWTTMGRTKKGKATAKKKRGKKSFLVEQKKKRDAFQKKMSGEK